MIDVRIFTPEDWQILRELRLAALKDSPEFFGGTYEEAESRKDQEWQRWPRDGRAFGAFLDSQPVGMAATWPNPESPEAETLIGMWVAPSARSKGVAEAIIDAVVAAAEAKPVELNVYDNNPRAHAFYKRYGFVDVRRTDYGQPGVTMRLNS